MKELDETPSTTPAKLTPTSKTGSDEDAVFVESGRTTSASASEKGSMRKKKGKK